MHVVAAGDFQQRESGRQQPRFAAKFAVAQNSDGMRPPP
jgi:hypothetical protein